ncbi:DsrE family protein [Halorussus vallis]|uniref:DsrE family protein n=1 Tax=Halorussus vallis TaxID=2953749 RepID=UPI00209FAC55|nr:DsrE family protein [Halorussus vallis]USZ73967.1 DsrE family protein [Halorussus vallis]
MNVVLHFSGERGEQDHAVSNVENLLADDSTAVESSALVANGDGVALLTTDSTDPERVEALAENGVSLLACRNSLDSRGVDESDLLDGIETVPTGVGELAKLQADGYAYVKIP